MAIGKLYFEYQLVQMKLHTVYQSCLKLDAMMANKSFKFRCNSGRSVFEMQVCLIHTLCRGREPDSKRIGGMWVRNPHLLTVFLPSFKEVSSSKVSHPGSKQHTKENRWQGSSVKIRKVQSPLPINPPFSQNQPFCQFYTRLDQAYIEKR